MNHARSVTTIGSMRTQDSSREALTQLERARPSFLPSWAPGGPRRPRRRTAKSHDAVRRHAAKTVI